VLFSPRERLAWWSWFIIEFKVHSFIGLTLMQAFNVTFFVVEM
jgi:hypothetical protein